VRGRVIKLTSRLKKNEARSENSSYNHPPPRTQMSNPFFDHPILNSPYGYPQRHWELDEAGQPTQKIIESRRSAKFITPIPKPKKHKAAAQTVLVFDGGKGLSTKEQQYDPTSIINEVRGYRSASRRSATTPICRRSTTPNVTCSTSRAPVPEITCCSPASSLHLNFSMICGCNAGRP
jgi:hypothetical protein